MDRRANHKVWAAIFVFILTAAGAVWDCGTVRGEAQPEYPADGAAIEGENWPPNPPYTHIYTQLDFISGPNAVKHTGYFSDNYDDVASRVEDANLGEPPYPSMPNRYYVGLPLIPPANDTLVRGTTYYWTVDGEDAEGNIFPGEVWEFTIQDYYAFEPSPPNEAMDIDTDVLLSWLPGIYSCYYDVYIGTSWEDVNNAVYDFDNQPPEFLARISEPNIAVTGLELNTKYYWRLDELVGRSCCGSAPIYICYVLKGDVWSFTTVGGEAQPEFPADGAVIDGSPFGDVVYTRLDFIPGASAVEHTGYFSDNYDDVANRIEDANLGPPPFPEEPGYEYRYYVGLPPGYIPGDPYSDGLVRGTTYYWTVDERDAEGKMYPGEIWEFTIRDFKATEPDPPNEATFVETDVLLSWRPGYGPSQHYVLMGTSWEDVNNAYLLPFPPPELLCTVSEPNVFVTGLELNTRYYWRVDEALWLPPPGGPFHYIYKGDVWCFTTKPSPIYVDVDAVGSNNGTSWENAYNFLQDALAEADSALKPVEIRVAGGIYKPDRSTADPNGSGSRGVSFVLIDGVTIKGGYAGFGEPDPNGRDIEAYETILSGDLAGNDADVNEAQELLDDPCRAENSYHVVVSYQNDVNAVLDGFTITSGNASETYYHGGGGIYNNCSNPKVANCTFSCNTGSPGGGMYNIYFCYNTGTKPPPEYLGKPVVTGCTFIMNAAEYSGGGMFNGCYAEPTVTDCVFIDNWAGNFGGGMCNSYCDFEITNCTFIGNSTSIQFGGGGGMHNYDSNSIITNCTFIGNSTFEYGGGMFNRLSNPIVTGCTFRKNWAVYGGGGMANEEESSPIVTNCLFVENEAFDNGSGMFSIESSPRLINCTFSCNWSGGDTIVGGQSYTLTNCIVWGDWVGGWFGHELGGPAVVTYSNIQGGWPGEGNIDTNPCFVEPGVWADPCNTPGDYMDDIWVDGDYHLRSQAGRWEPNSESWVQDNITSPCIDAGNPGCPVGGESLPNGNRRNMGAYGETAEASKTPVNWRSVADFTNDWIVDYNDLKVFADYWLAAGECIASDLDRNKSTDFNDLALFGNQWSEVCISGRNIIYEIGECIPVESSSSWTEEGDETRFSVIIEGPYIYFNDMMRAYYCTKDLDLQMVMEEDLIMLHELEHTMLVCDSICDHMVTARLGPFEAGSYTIEVYQNYTFIGSTVVTIGPAD
jgi:hypothetical protein